ncbi:MAG: ParB/RepB/Spo0J family partition protein [Calditerrivibrio sp.]|nr:ParB/RepB/Spo0J family partition protein [Calditerrivibrio sp.]MCA1932733.1 ParB/RepB/Spo0J family partition protein [Calditerrivibrio sp.]MCA1979905.1 ParB/RepB/Spo0J family partition protein [Calditerrivibrio sp.]
MIKKNPLGRGLESLIPKSSEAKNISEIDIVDIVPNKDQPRRSFDDEKLIELAESIKQKGVIQPLLVTQINGKYQIIAGERRWRAAGMAGLKKIPAIVKNIDNENERLELAIIENIQREDLNPLELARAYKGLIDKYNYTQEQLSNIVSKSRATITNSLRLLTLNEKILEALSQNLISEGHARTLIGLETPDALTILQKIITHNLSVRETERLVKKLKNKHNTPEEVSKKDEDIFIKSIKNEIEDIFKTSVRIKHSGKGGKIELIYKSNEDLNRIISIIRGE